MKALVIGLGEVGTALQAVLSTAHDVAALDPPKQIYPESRAGFDVLHVCVPFADFQSFAHTVATARRDYGWAYTTVIVHTTVPVGTTRRLGSWAVHSPVHGVHPKLDAGLTTFTKYVGGTDRGHVDIAMAHLHAAGIPAREVKNPETSELSKLLCTTAYAWSILFAKEAHELADRYDADPEQAYSRWTKFYNEGYDKLGMSWVRRPILDGTPGPIGGHCLIPNARLLDSWVSRTVLERDRIARTENGHTCRCAAWYDEDGMRHCACSGG